MMVLPMLALIIKANTDLTIGRFALFGDEIITLDEVYDILHPNSFRHWIWAVGNGDEFKYGRVLFYLSALVSWLPEKLGGEQAQIIATRFFQSIVWLSAIWLLAKATVKDTVLQALLFFFLLYQPFTVYYSTMPKPEPEQLLFLGLYLYFYRKKEDLFGWHLIFLGIAWGCKISLLPVVLLLWGIIVIQKGINLSLWAKMIAFTFIGLFIGVPAFIKILWLDFQPIIRYREQVSEVMEVIGENKDNNILTWVNHLFYRFTHIHAYAIALWVLAGSFTTGLYLRGKNLKETLFSFPIILLGMALAWALPIMLFMDRLWGFYIQIPAILVFMAFFSMLENELESLSAWLKSVKLKPVILAITIVLVGFTGYFLVRQSYYNAQKLFNRSNEYSYQIPRYRILTGLLAHLNKQSGRQLKVSLEGVLYWPKTTGAAEIVPWYYPFYQWQDNYDIIILNTRGLYKPVDPRTLVPQGGVNWFVTRLWARSAAEFSNHITMAGKSCVTEPCYVEYPTPERTLRIWVKPDLIKL